MIKGLLMMILGFFSIVGGILGYTALDNNKIYGWISAILLVAEALVGVYM